MLLWSKQPLPQDISRVDLIIKTSIKEASLIIEDLNEYINDQISLEILLENFDGLNYSGE